MLGSIWNGGNHVLLDSYDRAVILIDGGSLFRAASHLNLEIDYEKLLPCLLQGRQLLRAHFYTGFSPGNQKQSAFLRWMRNHSYRVIQKELVVNSDGTRYADLSVEIAIDMLQFAIYAHSVNVLIVVSQNPDLVYALERIVHTAVRLEMVGARSMMPQALIDVADCFLDLESIQDQIRKVVR
jgi:uncharacterized LabA/DUF88 family protein